MNINVTYLCETEDLSLTRNEKPFSAAASNIHWNHEVNQHVFAQHTSLASQPCFGALASWL